ncbi:MAG: hypothetical protein FWC10_09435 [Lentimicrobiaceae bacterium]|nr:hypothetical protein [Lentimicrobiaceae bacterium]
MKKLLVIFTATVIATTIVAQDAYTPKGCRVPDAHRTRLPMDYEIMQQIIRDAKKTYPAGADL